jgi:transposase-like protein
MKGLMAMIERLTPAQREALVTSLGSRFANSEALDLVQGRVGRTPTCPKCRADKVVRNGQADGLQRYKCRGCGVTFNALTGTPLARLRHRDKWLLQAQSLDQGLSVRRAAARMGVHRTTSFR